MLLSLSLSLLQYLAGVNSLVNLRVQPIPAAHLAHVHPAGDAGAIQAGAQQQHLLLVVPVVRDEHLQGDIGLLSYIIYVACSI